MDPEVKRISSNSENIPLQNQERTGVNPSSAENIHNKYDLEVKESTVESVPNSELSSNDNDSNGDVASNMPSPVPSMIPTVSTMVADDTVATSNATLVADDKDIIEKEWIDKAKKIITDTKDDPYNREYQVGQMQIDYVKKRYGRDIGSAKR